MRSEYTSAEEQGGETRPVNAARCNIGLALLAGLVWLRARIPPTGRAT